METSIERLKANIESLAGIGATERGGVSRFSFTPEDMRARGLVAGWMEQAGLEVWVDNVGNIHGRRRGDDEGLPPIVTGSHLDSQPDGGRFDGVLGVLAAIEAVRTLEENGVSTRRPLEAVAFADEEGRFTPFMGGSRAMAGIAAVEEVYRARDDRGVSYLEAMRRAGIDPGRLRPAVMGRGDIEAFVELHIEQSTRLHAEGVPIGVVRGIIGSSALKVAIIGRADHQALPLHMRRNALLAAAEVVLAVDRIPRGISQMAVGLVGKLAVSPGAPAVVPGKVEFTINLRDISKGDLDRLENEVVREIKDVCDRRGLKYDIEKTQFFDPTPMSERVMAAIEDAARKLGVAAMRLHSGAGHDARNVARITDVSMIFVPSVDGRSHCPEERTEWDDVQRGSDVLMHTMLALDRQG